MRKLFAYVFVTGLCFILVNCDKEDKNDKDKDTITANGTIIDLVNLDGCHYVIRLDDGTYLEPINMDSFSSILRNNQRVHFSYEKIPESASVCMLGEIVKIIWIEEINCQSLLLWDNASAFEYPIQYPHDEFELDTAYITGDCIFFEVSYSGGCETHDFTLGRIAVSSIYNDFALTHDGHDDACDAIIRDTVCFDLTPLQLTDQTDIELHISIYTTELIRYNTLMYTF